MIREVNNLQRVIFSFRHDLNATSFKAPKRTGGVDLPFGSSACLALAEKNPLKEAQREAYDIKVEQGTYFRGLGKSLGKLERVERLTRMKKARLTELKRVSELKYLRAALKDKESGQLVPEL